MKHIDVFIPSYCKKITDSEEDKKGASKPYRHKREYKTMPKIRDIKTYYCQFNPYL